MNELSDSTWHMFTHVVESNQHSLHDIYVHGGLYPTHACTRCELILMHVYDCCRSLSWSLPSLLLAFTCTKREYCLYLPAIKLFHMSPPYLLICGIYLPFQVNWYVPNSKPSNEIRFCMLEQLMLQLGLPISSMLGVLFSEEWTPLLIHEKGSVTGMPSPMLKSNQNN